jgi:hypothetical protein
MLQLLVRHKIVETLLLNTVNEVTENEVFRLVILEVTLEVELAERLLELFEHHGLVLNQVLRCNETVTVNTLAFVDP